MIFYSALRLLLLKIIMVSGYFFLSAIKYVAYNYSVCARSAKQRACGIEKNPDKSSPPRSDIKARA